MRKLDMTFWAGLPTLLLMGGCLTAMQIQECSERADGAREAAAERVAVGMAARRLNEDFEIVFRDPDYLSTSNTLARAALANHFLVENTRTPTPEQFDRLVEAVKQRPDLASPLQSIWLSRHATVSQRMEFAVIIDHPIVDQEHNVKNRLEELLQYYLLPAERITEEEYRKLQKRVAANGYVHAWTEGGIRKRAFVRKEASEALEAIQKRREALAKKR